MAGDPYAELLRPLRIKGVVIRNRVMSTAHTSGAGEDGKPKERYQRYHEEKAFGGIGLTMIGGSTAIAPDTPGADMLHLDASTDEIVPYYVQLAARVHRHGAAVFAQLAHMGRRANWDNQHWLPVVAPSDVREPAHRAFPKEMEDWDIRRLVRAFADAAGRVKAGGIDGVELSATHGHLIDQFWSPRTNVRVDRYGGSLENRLRFSLEALQAVRRSVGDEFVVGVRMSGDELLDGGLEFDDCLAIARALVSEGTVDYLSILGGQAENLPAHATIFPSMAMRAAPFAYLAAAVKEEVGVPVFHAQRVNDVGLAARLVAERQADMVAMTRAHLADPHIVRKLLEGRADDIRPCIGANYCIDRLYAGGQALCLHNPASGREQRVPHIVPRSPGRKQRVTVIGGGPAGLEAARVCALRGHDVTLYEKEERVGGQVELAAAVSWRESMRLIPRWLLDQARKAGARVLMGHEIREEALRELEADVVIVATGGRPRVCPIPGAALAVSAEQVLGGRAHLVGQVLVFDDNGRENALLCAEYLSVRGVAVELVSPDPHVAPLIERTTRPTFLKHLYDADAVFTPDHRVTLIYAEGAKKVVVMRNEYNGVESERVVDGVVLEHGSAPQDGLYLAMRPHSINLGEVDLEALLDGRPQATERNPQGRFALFRVGDAVASRNIHAAIYDALRLCKDI